MAAHVLESDPHMPYFRPFLTLPAKAGLFDPVTTLIRSYWAEGDKCIYVGRGTSGGQRPASHLVDVRFQNAKWLEIYTFGGPTLLHKIECMATRLYDPSLNKVASSRYERDKSCPLCIRYKIIEDELNAIFI